MQPNDVDARCALGLVMLNPLTTTAEGTLAIIGMLRQATRLLEHRYAHQIGERHEEPVPAFLQRKAAQDKPKNKGGRPRGTGKNQRKAAAQPPLIPPEPQEVTPAEAA